MKKSFKKSFKKKYEELAKLCATEEGVGDPFSYGRAKEIYIAIVLDHQISNTLLGADGIDKDGECEYKSTTGERIKATYNGVMRQPTWEEQLKYLQEVKLGKYENHYFARFDECGIVELWHMKKDTVLEILVPKFEKQYPTCMNNKDPRLGANLTTGDIRNYGVQLI